MMFQGLNRRGKEGKWDYLDAGSKFFLFTSNNSLNISSRVVSNALYLSTVFWNLLPRGKAT